MYFYSFKSCVFNKNDNIYHTGDFYVNKLVGIDNGDVSN